MYLVKRFTYFDFSINLLSLDLRLRILGNRILSKYIVFLRLAMTDYDCGKYKKNINIQYVFFFHNNKGWREQWISGILRIVFDLSP